MTVLRSIDPTTEQLMAEYPVMSGSEVDALLTRAIDAQRAWRACDRAERAKQLFTLAAVLRQNVDDLATLVAREMGKPITEARAEIEKSAFCCTYYAENSDRLLSDEPHPSDSSRSYVAFRPLGLVLAVMPWNFPIWQVVRAVVPAIVAGNGVVLKHASNVTGCARVIERLFVDAGFPAGLVAAVLVPGRDASRLIEDDRIHAVTVTGSEATGRAVARVAGQSLKKCVLELGGSDAFIVLADADISAAAAAGAFSRFHNAGQSCGAAKRFIVVSSVAREFLAALLERAASFRVGNPLEPATEMGPLARAAFREQVLDQVRRSVSDGARLHSCGDQPERCGYFLAPAVLTGCDAQTAAFREEVFGPVAAVSEVPGLDAAVALANSSPFGLSAAVWTADEELGQATAERLETGGVFVNGITHSDPRRPFGGIKRSGYGRELAGLGLREFVNAQTVWTSDATSP